MRVLILTHIPKPLHITFHMKKMLIVNIMKTLKIFILGLMMCLCLSSCYVETYATTQDDMYVQTEVDVVKSDVNYNIVIRYGTPYYYNGNILYYIYNNLYYYPYYYNDYWYFRVYRRPFPYTNYRPYFRPHRYDYRFDRGYRQPHNWYRYTPSTRRRYNSRPHPYNVPRNTIPNRQPNMNRGTYNMHQPSRGNINRSSRGHLSSPMRSIPSRGNIGGFRDGRR